MSVALHLLRFRMSQGLLCGKAATISGMVCERRERPRRSRCLERSRFTVVSCRTEPEPGPRQSEPRAKPAAAEAAKERQLGYHSDPRPYRLGLSSRARDPGRPG